MHYGQAAGQQPRAPAIQAGGNPVGSGAGQSQSGLWHFWVTLTGPGDDAPQRTIEERARLRRARLSSVVIAGMLLLALLVLPLGLQDPTGATLTADIILFVATLTAAVCNRLGQTTLAGIILVGVLMLAVLGAVAGAKQLDWVYLPAFDLLGIVVVVAATLLLRWQMWIVALVAAALVVVDFAVQPKAGTTQSLATFVGQYGIYPLVARPIIVVLVVAILLHLLSRALEAEVHRADRAEDMAALEHEVAEQRRQLEAGVQELLATHVRVANGDFSARAPMNQGNVLWQVSASLNNLLGRLQKTGQSDFQLKRTEQEIDRLAEALLQAREGRRPIWPAPTGTRVDRLLEVLLGGQRQPVAPPTGHFSAQMGQVSAPQLQGNPGGQPGWENPWQSAPPQAAPTAPFDTDAGAQWGGGGPMRGFGEE